MFDGLVAILDSGPVVYGVIAAGAEMARSRRNSRNKTRRPAAGTTKKTEQQKSRGRGWTKLVIAALGALGILSGVVAYYLPGILKSGGSLIVSQSPLVYTAEVIPGSSSFVFPDSVSPALVPAAILRGYYDDPQAAEQAFDAWAGQHEGIVVAPQVRLILRARDASPVIITSVTIQVTGQRPGQSGWFNTWYGCGGVVDVRTIRVDLDKRPFVVTWLDASGTPEKPPVLSVTNTDNEVIEVQVLTGSPMVADWVIDVSYSAAGSEGTLRVDNHGKPFAVTSLLGSVAYSYRDGSQLTRDPAVDPGKSGNNVDGAGVC